MGNKGNLYFNSAESTIFSLNAAFGHHQEMAGKSHLHLGRAALITAACFQLFTLILRGNVNLLLRYLETTVILSLGLLRQVYL